MAESRRSTVVAAAMRVLSRDEDSTMQEVAAAAGVSVRTLFRWFRSRDELLAALHLERAPVSQQQRILSAAFDLLRRGSLAELSMDDVARVAGVSRATLYRAFPGKPALFRALIESYSPWEAIADVLAAAGDASPQEVMPRIARAMAGALDGRTGALLRMVFEMIKGEPDAVDGVRRSLSRGLPDVMQYLSQQMQAGRLRRMHPILAIQLLAGPIFVHIATRPLAKMVGFKGTTDDVVNEIVEAWLRALAPARPRD
jgi:AcrR family transcriptional regulator